jgi:putative transposase
MAKRGRPLVIAWRTEDSEEALRAAYRAEQRADARPRLHALWLLRSGKRALGEVADLVGADYRTVQDWVCWYRQGGIDAVRAHRRGGHGRDPYLSPPQQEEVAREVATGRFRSAAAVGVWIAETYGVTYRQGGIESLLERLRCAPKVPRPLHEKADLAAQEAWKKGDCPPC